MSAAELDVIALMGGICLGYLIRMWRRADWHDIAVLGGTALLCEVVAFWPVAL